MSELALKHVKHLSTEIGPRGSCTEGERKGHEYCRKVLNDLNYETHWEDFRAPLSTWHPFALATGLVLLAELLSLLERVGPLIASVLTLIVIVSFFLHVTHRDNPLRWFLPVGNSQNVWAKAEPKGETKRTVVIMGHVDTHRTAWVFSGRGPFIFLQVLNTLMPIALVGLLTICVVSIFAPSDVLRQISFVLAAIVLVAFGLALWPDFTKHVPGANDNATGVATVLDFAAQLKESPLEHTEAHLVVTGCEEVGAYGAAAFVAAHPELVDADYLVVDNIGSRDTPPTYILDETTLFPVKADPTLVDVARRVAAENEEYEAQPKHTKVVYTDMSPVSLAGRRAIAFVNYDPKTGVIPDWHQQTDTFERVDAEVLDKTENYIWDVLQALDRRA